MSRTVLSRLQAGLLLAWLLHGSASAEALSIEGKVTLPDGAPAAGLTLELVSEPSRYQSGRLMLSGRWRPAATTTAVTNAEGSFVIEAPEPGMWRVRLEAEGWRPMEYQLFPLLGHTLLPSLTLTPEVPAEVRLLSADAEIVDANAAQAKPVRGGAVRAEGPGPSRGEGEAWQPAWRQAFAGEDGVARLGRGTEEALTIYAWAPGHLESQASGVMDATLRLERGVPFPVVVTDHQGRALEGVEVRYGDRRWPIGRTDDSGSIEVPMAPRGEQTIELVLADGRRLYRGYDPRAWSPGEPNVISLPPPSRRHGRLLDAETGTPLAAGFAWQAGRPGDYVSSDPQGRFSLTLGGEGAEVWIWAAAAGHVKDAVLSSSGDRDETTIPLRPEASAGGIVVDETGRPIAGVDLAMDIDRSVHRGGAPAASWQLDRTKSAEDGSFTLGSLHPEASYLLRASKPGFATAELPIPEPGSPTLRNLRIELQSGRLLTGTVTGPGGELIGGASVELSKTLPSGPMQRVMESWRRKGARKSALSDTSGRFEIIDLAPGTYALRISAAGYAPSLVPAAEVSTASGATDIGEVSLDEGAAIRGRITDRRGRPLEGARIRISFDTWNGRFSAPVDEGHQAVSDADGEFSILDLSEGARVDLSVELSGYATAQVRNLVAPSGRTVEIELGPASRISGRVVDGAGRPVEGAQVLVARQRLTGRNGAISDTEGRFEIEDVDPGTIELMTEAEGFVTHHLAHQVVDSGHDLEGVTITLERGATVSGRVTDAAGAPVADASVMAWNESGFGTVASAVHTRSDGDGRYRLEGVPEGRHRLEARHRNYAESSREVVVEGGDNRFDITFEESASLAGRVLDEAGAPIAGARISSMRFTLLPGGNRSGSGGPDTVSDPTGSFTLKGLAPGTYELSADAAGYGGGVVTDLEVGSSGLEGVEIRLSEGSTIVGRLYGLEPSDYRRVEILAHRDGGVGYSSFLGIVSPEGDYRIDDVSPGTYSVNAEVEDSGLTARESVEVLPGLSAVLDLRFETGVTVTGRVLVDGEPLPQGHVMIESVDGTRSAGGRTDATGGFEIRGLEPGAARLRVFSLDGSFDHGQEVEVTDGSYFEIDVEAARVTGVVFDAGDSSPLAGAKVQLEPREQSVESAMRRWLRPNVTDSTGVFRLTHVPTGSYRMLVSRDGYAPAAQDIEVSSGIDIEGIEILLEPSEGLDVLVLLPDGRRAPFFSAAVVDRAGRVILSDHFRDSEAGARLDVPAGQWTLLISGANTALSSTRIAVPSEPLTIVLEEAAQLRVDVPALRADPAEATLRVTGPNGGSFSFFMGTSLFDRWPVRAGRAGVPGLPAGTWVVTVEAADGRVWQGTAALSAGENPEMVLP